MSLKVLVVDDEDGLRRNIIRFAGSRGHDVDGAASIAEAKQMLGAVSYHVLLTDLRLPDGDGLELAQFARESNPDTAIIFMTAYASVDSVVDALRCGACDYLTKPFSLQGLGRKLENIQRYRRLMRQNAYLRQQVRKSAGKTAIVSKSQAMGLLLSAIEKVAATPSNVLIYGETGVGKELVARKIHELSGCNDGLFVPLNIATLPDALVESHLFGHKRGAFTGAERDREGAFRAAAGGTLFLDEIGEMPLHIQPKLLRALENREITPLGKDHPEHVNTRVVAATHRDLEAMVTDGGFRQDLFMRLNMFALRVPPLRERKDDIPLLAQHLLQRHCRTIGKTIVGFREEAISRLIGCDWSKGNVRELSNALERATILCNGEHIEVADLPPDLASSEWHDQRLDLREAVRRFEQGHINAVLDSVDGDRAQAARILGISVATLYRHLAVCNSGESARLSS